MEAGISRYFCGSMDIFRLIAIATLFLLFTGQVEAVREMNDTSALDIYPVYWPQDTLKDPYHNHSGHVLQEEGSILDHDLDLLNTLPSSIRNSDIHLNGTLYHSTSESPNAIGLSTILLIDCGSPDAEGDFLRATRIRAKAVIFYTERGNCCAFKSSTWEQLSTDGLLVFTFANMKAFNSPKIETYQRATSGTFVNIVHRSQTEGDSIALDPVGELSTHDYEKPERGSAMLIVYIIVALISGGFIFVMLFLGMKAYKRYGNEPTQHLRARPRQSRARGIARTALDTLPVVKFGSRPLEAAPKDLEMQDGASSLGARESTNELGLVGAGQITLASVAEPQTSPPTTTTPLPTEPPPAYTPVSRGTEAPGATEPDPNQVRCPVCLDDFEEDQEVRVLPCSHSFHTNCIDPWLLNVVGSCPLCRIDLRSPEERERDNLANTLPPPPPTLTSRPRSSSVRSGRLQAMLDVARGNSSREERLAALRAVRDEGVSGHVGRVPRSRRPELGVSRLRRAVFGNDASEGNGGIGGESVDTRDVSQRAEDNTGPAESGAVSEIHSRSLLTGTPR